MSKDASANNFACCPRSCLGDVERCWAGSAGARRYCLALTQPVAGSGHCIVVFRSTI
jgi:hypothetical protein